MNRMTVRALGALALAALASTAAANRRSGEKP